MELALRKSAVPESREDASHTQAADMQPNERDNILQFPATMMGSQRETGQRRKWLVVLSFTGAILLAIILTAVTMHYTYHKGAKNPPKAPSSPKVKNERRETWRRYEGDSYLFWHSDNADCDSAKEFCAERKANLTLIDQNNLQWLQGMSKGKRLWVLQESEGSGSEDQQNAEAGDVTCALLKADSNRKLGDGWVCIRRS
ncbi:uncharacterized protein LOC122133089 [Clupea harengus]|uniref:Uncharacterized protein LOC122133089 n=1 Tax=Clupea harengus TaxID=7950 RepID=A0A8M1KK32_CLUHA|nr:uncharacterized protein LOC122133089 [Clupea harengus]